MSICTKCRATLKLIHLPGWDELVPENGPRCNGGCDPTGFDGNLEEDNLKEIGPVKYFTDNL